MANAEHLRNLLQGPGHWNTYIAYQMIGFRPNLRGANLYGADLSGAYLAGADLNGAKLTGADLAGAELNRAELYGANLAGADLNRAELNRADLTGADLYGANLNAANLNAANLNAANLNEADLTGADLYGANLTEADLTRADLTRADLTGADLTLARLTRATLAGAVWDNSTVWPEGFTAPFLTEQALSFFTEQPISGLQFSATRGDRRFRVSIDVGPSASFQELSRVLANLGVLSGVAAGWNSLEEELAANEDSDLLVLAPPRTRLGGTEPTIISLAYNNPMKFEIGGDGAGLLAGILGIVRDWKTGKTEAEISQMDSQGFRDRSEGALLRAQARETAEQTRRARLENDLLELLVHKLPETDFKAKPEQVIDLIMGREGALESMNELAQYEITVEEEPPPDTSTP